ncbi:NAD-dependent protein deacylase [Bacillus canaveralius]|uniref:protein acetyllysine N-acetyltransferase n=1 Tax=Bacillus canaveralius TaxID=1403243 RepID=A0A2N5GGP7_9BACI|nr:NAD-dependent protein deacylase [Bacillus canaveralius]PLR79934.1 NAD-dependent protein deacylase [Bacillus canaveralius]PLR88443.1 NAD-dependent protein deacylase [Bacillus canaveralius]
MGNNTIEECANIIKKSKNIVVLTGAGISTESGIKDFRSRTGIYKMAPEYILSLDYFYENPKDFYQFAFENLYHPDSSPNKGHEILAKWENEGRVKHIITQNIDRLHQKAGSKNVIEFHGTMETATCLNCDHKYSTEEMAQRYNQMDDFYVCDHCSTDDKEDRYIKPDVVLFGDTGDWFTVEGFNTIIDIITEADCVLVLGASLKVTPFSTFPAYRETGMPLIIINKGDTSYDFEPDTYVIKDFIGETLRRIDERL